MRQAIGKILSQPQITTTVIPSGDQVGRILMSSFTTGMKAGAYRIKVKVGGGGSGIVYVWGRDGGPLNDGVSGDWGVLDGENGGGALNNAQAITKTSFFVTLNLGAVSELWFEARTVSGTLDISVAEITGQWE